MVSSFHLPAGDDDKFAHAGDARSHGAEPVEEPHSGEEADDTGREDAEQQHRHHVHSGYRRTQHDEVGDCLYPFNLCICGAADNDNP